MREKQSPLIQTTGYYEGKTKDEQLEKTPYAWVSAMTCIQTNNLETFIKHPWNTLETILKHS